MKRIGGGGGRNMETIRKRSRIFTICAVLVAMFCLAVGAGNTVSFERMMNQVVERYVSENNQQVASQISYRLKMGREFVSDFADTLSRMPQFLLTEDFISRKTAAVELEGLMVLFEDGSVFPESACPDYLSQWFEKNPDIWEKQVTSYVADQNLIFTAPVHYGDGTEAVVVGLQNYWSIKALVFRADYQEQGASFLIDRKDGEILIADEKSALSVTDQQLYALLETGRELEGDRQVYEAVMPNGQEVFVSLYEVRDTDWVQAAVIPSDFLMAQIERHMDVYAAVVVAVMVLLGVLIGHLMKENQRWERLSVTEPLTGGWSREGFIKLGTQNTEGHRLHEWIVVYLNIKDFRHINESWGEEDGNLMLQFIYRMLSGLINEEELVSRSSMDHFFLLLKEEDDREVNRRILKMKEAVNERIRCKFSEYSIDFAVGACRLDIAGGVPTAMNKAIYASKLSDTDNVCSFYNAGIANMLEREERLNTLFEDSVKNRDFKVYLQPKVSPSETRACQAEALVRWFHPQEGVIYPSEFIPIFEKNGKICSLDLYMFEEVCRLIDRWIKEKKALVSISVNVSRFHLREAGSEIWKEYKRILDRYDIPEGVIEMELTETILLEENQIPFVKAVLNGFRSCGLRVALDDFGFAYSSLSMLKEFAVDTLKMDRSFFVNENDKSRKIVGSIIQLAHSLDMDVVAEGIEAKEQVEMLRKMGCDLIQGYVYSKPLPVGEFEQWREEYDR